MKANTFNEGCLYLKISEDEQDFPQIKGDS